MQECKPEFPTRDETGVEEPRLASSQPEMKRIATRPPSFLAGAAWALFAISIWSGWFVSSRLDISGNLTSYDLVALRFGVAAVILLPVTIHLRGGLGLLSWPTALSLFAGSGFFYSLVTTGGLTLAPAAEGAALTPGVMPMATALLSVLVLKERVTRSQLIGLCLIFLGASAIAGLGLLQSAHHAWMGHILFVTGAFLFAGYTIALRRSGLSGMQATAIVSLWSCLCYLPVYFLALHPRIFEVPATSLIVPAIYQGVLTNVISLIAYARAVSILGPSRAASFAALIPAVTALLGILFLNERPTSVDWAGIACVSAGVYLASGAPLRWMSNALRKIRSD
jgi:drug/metabolite transporter (DMT)-like permease